MLEGEWFRNVQTDTALSAFPGCTLASSPFHLTSFEPRQLGSCRLRPEQEWRTQAAGPSPYACHLSSLMREFSKSTCFSWRPPYGLSRVVWFPESGGLVPS